MLRHLSALAASFLVLSLLLISTPKTWAQKGVVNPEAPNLAPVAPFGVQRGKKAELTLTGTALNDPTGVWTSFAAKSAIPDADKNGTVPTKLVVQLDVPGDAPLGIHAIRVGTKKGVSNLRLLCVDDLPQVAEAGKNNAKNTPQKLTLPIAVAGQADAETGDFFLIPAKKGQRLSFDLLGRRLGSALDGQLTLFHAKSGRELAFDNDSPGAQTDPRLSHTFAEDGEALLEVRDVLNRGGAEYFYRLRVGEFPIASTTFPLAAKRGGGAQVEFVGPQVEGVKPVDVKTPADPATLAVRVAPVGASGQAGNSASLLLTDLEEVLEKEPNNEASKAQTLPVPCGVSGRFQNADDADFYRIPGKKGQKLTIEGQTLELGSPSIIYMVARNAKGADIAKSTPQSPPPADQKLEVTPTEDGDILLEVQHLNYAGGPNEAYRLVVTQAQPNFELTLVGDRQDLSPGTATPLLVQVNRQGYTGPIDLKVHGSPGLDGSVQIKAAQNSGILLVQAAPDAPLGPRAINVLGTASIDGKKVTKVASIKAGLSAALAGLNFPPLPLQSTYAIGVREKGPITLVAKLEFPEYSPGTTAKVTLTAQREKGFADEITINPPVGLPATVPVPKIAAIGKDKNEISFTIDLNAKTVAGEYVVLFSGKTKHEKKDVTVGSLPLVLLLGAPFDLKIEPADIALTPGGKAKFQVSAVRKAGYKGPITLDVRKLPAEVTASKASIDMGKDMIEIELTATAKAAPIEKLEIDVQGTATALNNLQNASPALNLKIGKK